VKPRAQGLVVLLVAAALGCSSDEGAPSAVELTTTTTAAPAGEAWQGTYAGDVTWNCGTSEQSGALDGVFTIEVQLDKTAVLTGDNTITGSCASTGELTTPITMNGERTPEGFEFPAALWQLSDVIRIEVTDGQGAGGISGSTPSGDSITIEFVVECVSGC
jgi:hypothetical protein